MDCDSLYFEGLDRILSFIPRAESITKELQRAFSRGTNTINSLEYSIQQYKDTDGILGSEEAKETMASFLSSVISSLVRCYRICETLDSVTLHEAYKKGCRDGCEVVATISNEGWLIVRTPLLLSHYTHLVKQRPFVTMDYTPVLRTEVSEALARIKDRLPRFDRINLSILSVYTEDRKFFPDPDNLDCKVISDTITECFKGDNGDSCTVFKASIRNNEIPAGAYFIISPCYNVPPSIENLLSAIRSIYASHEEKNQFLP